MLVLLLEGVELVDLLVNLGDLLGVDFEDTLVLG